MRGGDRVVRGSGERNELGAIVVEESSGKC